MFFAVTEIQARRGREDFQWALREKLEADRVVFHEKHRPNRGYLMDCKIIRAYPRKKVQLNLFSLKICKELIIEQITSLLLVRSEQQ